MPVITVQMLQGRTVEQKRALAKELTDAMVRTIGTKPEAINVVIQELPRENWATAGKLMSD